MKVLDPVSKINQVQSETDIVKKYICYRRSNIAQWCCLLLGSIGYITGIIFVTQYHDQMTNFEVTMIVAWPLLIFGSMLGIGILYTCGKLIYMVFNSCFDDYRTYRQEHYPTNQINLNEKV